MKKKLNLLCPFCKESEIQISNKTKDYICSTCHSFFQIHSDTANYVELYAYPEKHKRMNSKIHKLRVLK